MARKSIEMKRIETRRAEVDAEIARLDREIAAKRAERDQLDVAKLVIERLAGLPPEPETLPDGQPIPPLPDAPDPPLNYELDEEHTIGDLALMVLLNADKNGLTSNEILEAIRQQWMPNLARTSLSPPLSRLKKKGTIELDGEQWRIAAQNEAKS